MISLLCPTRRRPEFMHQFAMSAATTAEGPIELCFYIDGDDKESQEAVRELIEDLDAFRPEHRIRTATGQRAVLSMLWNALLIVAKGDIYGHMGDDIVFHTYGWDRKIEEAFARHDDRICFVHGRDGIHDARMGTHGFLHRNWVKAVGYFVPPYFSHDYNDQWLTEVADELSRRVFVPDVYTEHLHPDVGKRPYDDTYNDHAEAGQRDNVASLYRELAHVRERDVNKLRRAIRRFNEERFGPTG